MDREGVDYDLLARGYNARYLANPLHGIRDALLQLAKPARTQKVLEVGCGTGHWLGELRSSVPDICGADASLGMLHVAAKSHLRVVQARANALPFKNGYFDLVFCVNALHHFDDPGAFVEQSAELLTKPGALSITGIDPRLIRGWYLYDYFEGAAETDIRRYPAVGDIVNWMAAAGFDPIEHRVVDRRNTLLTGRAVLADPFLKKDSNSLLALLTDAEYGAGLQRIQDALLQAEKERREISFASELAFVMITGFFK